MGTPVHTPGAYVPGVALYTGGDGLTADPVTPGNPLPVVMASGGSGTGAITMADGANVALGAKADAAATSDTGAFSLIALVKRLLGKVYVGQATMASGIAIASDQSAVAVKPDNVPDNLTTTGSATSAAVVVSASNAGYSGGSFQFTSIGAGNIITFEQSNDGVNWINLYTDGGSSVASPQFGLGISINSFRFISSAAYVRARVSTYSSGTVTVALTQKRISAPVAVSLAAGSQAIGNVNVSVGYADSTAALGASGTFTGTARAVSSYAAYCYFTVFAYADQAGTLYIDWSMDSGATWQVLTSTAVAAGTTGTARVTIPTFWGTVQIRSRFVNGATAQGTFRLGSSFTAN